MLLEDEVSASPAAGAHQSPLRAKTRQRWIPASPSPISQPAFRTPPQKKQAHPHALLQLKAFYLLRFGINPGCNDLARLESL